MQKMEDLKNQMANLIERRRQLDRWEIDYEELVQCEKERVERQMWELITNGDMVGDGDINQELEDMLPYPICWR